ncbi:MAG: SDR family NAD(P)-dependent oxidoreductase [Candidatus Gastranaerophilaceae bacterium]
MYKNTAVITGTTSGLGKELLKVFVAAGWRVFAGYRNKDLITLQDNVEYFYIDMADRNSIFDAAEIIMSKTDKVDVLINAAGCVAAGPVEFLDTNRLRYQFEVNTFSHIEFMQRLLPVLDNSRIVNISSMSSFGHFPFISPYCASKRALDIFFNAFAIENHRNIKVISIKPGVIATPIWEKSVNANAKTLSDCVGYEKELEFIKNNALSNSRKGLDVAEVAEFIYKIAIMNNPKSSYTVGKDAKFASILSYLPQDLLNKLVKFGLKMRIAKNASK